MHLMTETPTKSNTILTLLLLNLYAVSDVRGIRLLGNERPYLKNIYLK